MSAVSKLIRLEYNSFYVAGSRNVHVPTPRAGQHYLASTDCINVGCRMWHDGEIRIDLGGMDDVVPTGKPRLDVMIKTPNRELVLFDANHPELARWPVERHDTRVRVWTNHETEPDFVQIIVGS